tara:strand:- start:2002 stop:2760 length:759 start_codon:yes stop_codon:yes gene_type:complete
MYETITEELTKAQNYYLEGYFLHKFSEKKTEKINSIIEDICINKKIKEGFSLVPKYHGTADLRPFAFNYDDEILEFLINAKIYETLKALTGQDLFLYHVQLRLTSPYSNLNNQESYMDWHRDSYFKEGKRVGSFPPAHKVIYYPSFENSEDALRIIPGSHKADLHADQSYKNFHLNDFDKYLIQNIKEEVIQYSNSQVVIFNTAALHAAAINQKHIRPRLIYSFLTRDQVENSEDSHRNLGSLFENKISKTR